MPRERRPLVFIALGILWLLIALSRAFTMIDTPTRWVDVLLIFVCGMLVGINLMRAKMARHAAQTPLPEVPGGPPNVPK